MTAAAVDTRRPAPVEARKPLLRSGRVRDLLGPRLHLD